MQITVEDFWDPYHQLLKSFELRDQNSALLIGLFSKVKTTYENIATWFRNLGETFHKDLQKDNSSEQSYSYYHYLGNYLLKISEINREFSKNISHNILTPFTESSRQIDVKTKENLEKINKALIDIRNSRNTLKLYQESYYKLSKHSDKTQEMFENLINTNKPEEQIMKGQERFMKIKMEAQEAANLYRQQLKSTNQNLEILYATYEPIFELYDELETQKSNKIKEGILNLVKAFNSFYSPVDKKLVDNEEKLRELEEKVIAKNNNLQLLTNGRLDELLKTKPMEEYLSYEAKKKIDELTLIKSVENDEYTVIYSASNETDLQFIIDFTKLFQSNRSMSLNNELNLESPKEEQQQNESLPSMDSTTVSRERSMSADLQNHLRIPLTADEEKKVWDIVKNPVNRKFLLENLYKSQELFKDSDHLIISFKSYKYLKTFLWKMLEMIMEEKDFDNLSTFLNVIFRYATKKGGETLYLSEHFRGQKIWRNPDLWKDIVKNFYDKKANEETEKQKKNQDDKLTKSFTQSPFMDKIINYGMKQLLEKTKSKEASLSENDIFNIYFSILRDIASYLAKLIEKMSTTSEILITIATELGFESQEVEDLIQVIRRERNMILRSEADHHMVRKQQRAPKKWGKYYPFYLSLDFLEPKDLLNLLQLNKQIRTLLKKKVYRTLFYNFGGQFNTQKRFKIWSNILEIDTVKVNFRDYLGEYENTDNANLKQAEEVIHIDVVRSFKKHGEYNQEELKDLLKGYAALDKESSYCQGMNYMMGFFYLQTRDPDLSFKYFARLMEKHMTTMFDKDFKQLRNYFFKLNRIVEIYIPDLAEHFTAEKIDSSFYAPSWFITAFSSTFQYSPKSKLLEKIWDYFVLDGVKAIFKVTILILKEFKSEIIQLRFDSALNFINDLGKQELFTNTKYNEIKEGKVPQNEITKEFRFIEEFETRMKELHLAMELLNSFDDDLEVFEKKIPKLSIKSPAKDKAKEQ